MVSFARDEFETREHLGEVVLLTLGRHLVREEICWEAKAFAVAQRAPPLHHILDLVQDPIAFRRQRWRMRRVKAAAGVKRIRDETHDGVGLEELLAIHNETRDLTILEVRFALQKLRALLEARVLERDAAMSKEKPNGLAQTRNVELSQMRCECKCVPCVSTLEKGALVQAR